MKDVYHISNGKSYKYKSNVKYFLNKNYDLEQIQLPVKCNINIFIVELEKFSKESLQDIEIIHSFPIRIFTKITYNFIYDCMRDICAKLLKENIKQDDKNYVFPYRKIYNNPLIDNLQYTNEYKRNYKKSIFSFKLVTLSGYDIIIQFKDFNDFINDKIYGDADYEVPFIENEITDLKNLQTVYKDSINYTNHRNFITRLAVINPFMPTEVILYFYDKYPEYIKKLYNIKSIDEIKSEEFFHRINQYPVISDSEINIQKNEFRIQKDIENVRNFHNWVKEYVLKLAIRKLGNKNGIKLLDLAVGRGGDLWKWKKNNIKYVVGFDIDNESINEAKSRYNSIKDKKNYDYNFYVADLSKGLPSLGYNNTNDLFDIVSCQFAIHYFFKNRESLDNLFQIISVHLKKGGIFIGTTLDGEKIVSLTNGNDFCNDTFCIENIKIKDGVYGNEYTITAGEKNGSHYFREKDSVEYMVSIHELKKIGKKYGLKFDISENFESLYYNKFINSPNYKEMTINQSLFSFLNFYFVFTKI